MIALAVRKFGFYVINKYINPQGSISCRTFHILQIVIHSAYSLTEQNMFLYSYASYYRNEYGVMNKNHYDVIHTKYKNQYSTYAIRKSEMATHLQAEQGSGGPMPSSTASACMTELMRFHCVT